jgi:Lrp/AsnC family transcriptional regulator for asnA, asnC and gidA
MDSDKKDIDPVDRAIILELQQDARRPFKAIAQKIKVSEGTVKNRVTKLVERGILKLEARVNPFRLSHRVSALVGVTLEKRNHKQTMKRIENSPEVTAVWNASGRYDLFFEIMVGSIEELHAFLFDRCLEQIKGIKATESFIILSSNTKYFKLPPS